MLTTRIRILTLVLTLAALGGTGRAETYEDLETGFKLKIPTGWKHKYDLAASALQLAGPGGIRVRLLAKVAALAATARAPVAS
ncbi:MAG: hypothetical protein HUU28_02835 [Planctomycetaceae bacterium]|nr:hypothetical protein [Planctomycetaceae bacterium]